MPTLRGWALSGAGLALLFLWYGLGEQELLLAAVFVILAQAAGVAYVRLNRPKVNLSRRLGSATVHDGDTTTVTLLMDNR